MCPRITKTPPKLLRKITAKLQKKRIFFGNACHFRKNFLIRARLRFFLRIFENPGKGQRTRASARHLHGIIEHAAQRRPIRRLVARYLFLPSQTPALLLSGPSNLLVLLVPSGRGCHLQGW